MTTITQEISALPTAPNPNTQTPSVFNTNATAHVAALSTMVTEQNTMASQMNTVAGEVNTNAASALASSTAAASSETAAVAAANFAGTWSSLTGAQTAGISVSHDGALWLLLSNVADVTADEPGQTASWQKIYGAGQVYARTSNVIVTALDNGKIFDVTSGTFSQTFDPCADLGENFSCYFMNSGTGVVTFDPDGSELIDGASTKILKKDTLTLVICDGSALTTIELLMPISDDHVTVVTGNGHGSTNTRVRRFSTTKSSSGEAITYADSSTDGASFTINEPGLYAISYQDSGTSATTSYGLGVSLNSAQLTTDIQTITEANRLLFSSTYNVGSGADSPGNASGTFNLAAGDVIRPHSGGANIPNATATGYTSFTIRKVRV